MIGIDAGFLTKTQVDVEKDDCGSEDLFALDVKFLVAPQFQAVLDTEIERKKTENLSQSWVVVEDRCLTARSGRPGLYGRGSPC